MSLHGPARACISVASTCTSPVHVLSVFKHCGVDKHTRV